MNPLANKRAIGRVIALVSVRTVNWLLMSAPFCYNILNVYGWGVAIVMSEIQPVQDQTQASADLFGLGITQGQRSAEVVAAARADRMPSPETKALSHWTGTVFVKLFFGFLSNQTADAMLNYLFVRNEGMRILSNDILERAEDAVFVDIASGLSPRALFLAREAPNMRVIEIDQKVVIDDKVERLQKAKISIPDNLEWLKADLGTTPLNVALDGLQADVITAEGLNPYFTPEEVTRIASGVKQSLKPGGVYLSTVTLREGVTEIENGLKFLSRQIGRTLSIMENADDAKQLFTDAGYSDVTLYLPTDLAQTYDMPTPVINLEGLVVARV